MVGQRFVVGIGILCRHHAFGRGLCEVRWLHKITPEKYLYILRGTRGMRLDRSFTGTRPKMRLEMRSSFCSFNRAFRSLSRGSCHHPRHMSQMHVCSKIGKNENPCVARRSASAEPTPTPTPRIRQNLITFGHVTKDLSPWNQRYTHSSRTGHWIRSS